MKQSFVGILVLLIIGALSVYAYNRVEASQVTDLKEQVKTQQELITSQRNIHSEYVVKAEAQKQKIKDAFVMLFPAQAEQIEAALYPPAVEESETETTTEGG
jgi:hypothetical protein